MPVPTFSALTKSSQQSLASGCASDSPCARPRHQASMRAGRLSHHGRLRSFSI